jgi:hypothetical protein
MSSQVWVERAAGREGKSETSSGKLSAIGRGRLKLEKE